MDVKIADDVMILWTRFTTIRSGHTLPVEWEITHPSTASGNDGIDIDVASSIDD